MSASLLIFRPGSMGDTIVSLPSLHMIRRRFPHHLIVLLENRPVSRNVIRPRDLLAGSGLVDQFIDYLPGKSSILSALSTCRTLRAHDFEFAVYLGPPRDRLTLELHTLFLRMCSAKRVIGTRSSAHSRQRLRLDNGLLEPESQRLLRSISELGTGDIHDHTYWSLNITEQELLAAKTSLGDIAETYMCVGLGSKWRENIWPIERWISLISEIHRLHPQAALVAIGGPDDTSTSAHLLKHWPGPSVNLCGRLPARICAALLTGARAYLGHDSGPLHLAASLGVPTLGIFSARNEPGIWYPIGNRSLVISCHHTDSQSLEELMVEDLLSRAHAFIEDL